MFETSYMRAHGCKHYALAEPTIFAPPQTPFPGTYDGQNLISWRRSLYLHLHTQVKIDESNFEISW